MKYGAKKSPNERLNYFCHTLCDHEVLYCRLSWTLDMHDVTFLSLGFQNFKTLNRSQKSKEHASVRTDSQKQMPYIP